jgi:A/G-specific adenine glycosylase
MPAAFSARLVAWQRACGRHDLPWQQNRDPYAVWVSEIMLQQTQVAAVVPYYQRFMARFPTLAALAGARQDAVLAAWSGLGYYARARHLHRAARTIVDTHGGAFPREFDAILALPGIGRSTAAAISVFAFGARRAILDGNVKRVLCRWRAIAGHPGTRAVEKQLWALAESLLPENEVERHTQGLMDLGATVCTRARPDCARCPLAEDCVAHLTGRTGEFPSARPQKPLPTRSTSLLLLFHQGDILLEKRPPAGIWGGLWSLPEGAPHTDPRAAAENLGLVVKSCRPLEPFTHTFSHFHLAIAPWRLDVDPAHRAEEAGRIWVALDDALAAALPAPVRKLLALSQEAP